jgi:Fur family transcriptional regulator, peroxide stress response regulator
MTKNRNKELKVTPQRAAIFEYLEGHASHPSAEEIFEAIYEKYPMISIATVYHTLRTLLDMGRIKELTIDEERKRYDPNTEPHHHMICDNCKKIVHIQKDFPLDVPKELAQGSLISGWHVEFHGLCRQCSQE